MIKEYRKQANLTQEQLAEKLEISTRQLQRLEKETDVPSFTTLQRIVLILNINDKDLANYIRNLKRENKP